MSEESIDVEIVETGGVSRRAALKAGVAAGVGAVAWSGVSITSLGGTPAYAAAGCTGIINIDLGGGCRNTDQGKGSNCTQDFRYHQLKPQFLPPGFELVDLPKEGTCCDVAPLSPTVFQFPAGLCCQVFLIFYPPSCPAPLPSPYHPIDMGKACQPAGPTPGQLNIEFPCPSTDPAPFTIQPSDKHQIFAKCASVGADPSCITPAPF